MLHGLDKIFEIVLALVCKAYLGKQWNAFYYVHQRLFYWGGLGEKRTSYLTCNQWTASTTFSYSKKKGKKNTVKIAKILCLIFFSIYWDWMILNFTFMFSVFFQARTGFRLKIVAKNSERVNKIVLLSGRDVISERSLLFSGK